MSSDVTPPERRWTSSCQTALVAAALAVVAFLMFPVVFGPLAMLRANKALQRDERYARPAMLLAIVAVMLGIDQAYLLVIG